MLTSRACSSYPLGAVRDREQHLELFRHLGSRGEAILRTRGQQTVDHRDQGDRQVLSNVRDRNMPLLDAFDHSIHLGHARKGKFSRQQPVHGAAETELIRPRINRLPIELLG